MNILDNIINYVICYSDNCPRKDNCKTHYYNNELDFPQYDFYQYDLQLYGGHVSLCGEEGNWGLYRE